MTAASTAVAVAADRTPRRPSGAGFSLIEVMLAISMMGVMMLGFLSIFPLGLRTVAKGERMTIATSLAQDEIERLKTLPATDPDLVNGTHIDATNPIQGVYTRTWTVTDDTPMVGMKTITLAVSYVENGVPRTISLTTYLAS